MSGIFYSIGMGPGDPELVTQKAILTLAQCEVVAVPDSQGSENVVLGIAGSLAAGKTVVYCDAPMIRDKAAIDRCHQQSARMLADYLDCGQNVAFLTLGDPSIYSTANYVQRHLDAMGHTTRMIPGVPSFCAVAARLNQPLCEAGQSLHIIPATAGAVEQALQTSGTQVFMKAGKNIRHIKQALIESGNGKTAQAVERCGMAEEKVHWNLDTLDEDASYFSIVIVKEAQP
jgi:precorrin-2/cobalt-factor-2 C20-methyltransferase